METISWQQIVSHSTIPPTCGVYRYLHGKDILYIGKAVNIKSRLASHAQMAHVDERERSIVEGADRIEYTLCDTEFSALLLEATLIQHHRPRYNRALRDDKSYLYIALNMHDVYPKPRLVRGKDLPSLRLRPRGLRIYGPFPSTYLTEEVLRTIRRLIPFCQQSRVGVRPCFYSHLGLCNPCPSGIKTRAERLRYRRQLRHIARILDGQIEPVIKALEKEMQLASENENFEQALTLRNKINRFELALHTHSFSDGRVLVSSSADADLVELEKALGIPLPRIECYDASTFAFHDSVVSMVVATGGRIDKSQYRRFKIKIPRSRSDFDMLAEALERRLHNRRWPSPSLILIDGGRPQLRRLQPLLDQLESPPLMLGLAKHPDRILLNDQLLELTPPALRLLQRLRDEAHRFANSYRKILVKRLSFNG